MITETEVSAVHKLDTQGYHYSGTRCCSAHKGRASPTRFRFCSAWVLSGRRNANLGKAICFRHFTNSDANLFCKHLPMSLKSNISLTDLEWGHLNGCTQKGSQNRTLRRMDHTNSNSHLIILENEHKDGHGY